MSSELFCPLALVEHRCVAIKFIAEQPAPDDARLGVVAKFMPVCRGKQVAGKPRVAGGNRTGKDAECLGRFLGGLFPALPGEAGSQCRPQSPSQVQGGDAELLQGQSNRVRRWSRSQG